MGSCSNKGVNTKEGIQIVTILNPNVKPQIVPDKTESKNVAAHDQNHNYKRTDSQKKLEMDAPKRLPKSKEKNALAPHHLRNSEPQIADAPTAIISNPIKSKLEIEQIENCLRNHFVFKTLTDFQIKEVTNSMKLYTLESYQTIFEEKTPGNKFFIVAKGKLEATIQGKQVNILEPVMSFGEGSLLQNSVRTATIRTIEKSAL